MSLWKAITLQRGPRESSQIPTGTCTSGSFPLESRGQRVALLDTGITVPVPAT